MVSCLSVEQMMLRAFDALQVKGFRKDNEFYQELLELCSNSQVQVRQVMDLLEDVEFVH